ncbi:MAG: phage holin family protein [Acidaminococcaceae bacterium]|nr:phage holin family protein [Acidaminococcaceae bacterium]
MNGILNYDTLKSVVNHLPEKLAASAGAMTLASALGIHLQLMSIFTALAVLDIITRCICQARHLWVAMYPQSPASYWCYFRFCWQASRWRFIKSEIMREKFKSKFLTYFVILLAASLCDMAMLISGSPLRFALSIITAILCCTELLSVLENIAETGCVPIATELIAIIKKRKEQIK